MTESVRQKQDEIPSSQRNTKEEDERIAAINKEGRIIFDDFMKRKKNDKAFADLDPQSKYEFYMKRYPDFARSSPIILRYITFGMFSEKANFLYHKQCFRLVTKTDEDFAERQADFIKYLYHCTTRIRGAQLDKIWSDTKSALMKELTTIAELNAKVIAEREAKQTANDEIRREALKSAVIKAVNDAKEKLARERMVEKIAELSVSDKPTTQTTTPETTEADAKVDTVVDTVANTPADATVGATVGTIDSSIATTASSSPAQEDGDSLD